MVLDVPITGPNIEYHKIEENYLLDEIEKDKIYTIKDSIDIHLQRLYNEESTVFNCNNKRNLEKYFFYN